MFITGCSSTKIKENKEENNDNIRREKIMSFYDEWKGTTYKLGGNDKNGIDCSSFIQQLYSETFNTKLPRTTNLMINEGKEIHLKKNWQVGDLVFFKTGKNSNHVGIYIGNNQFIHTSTKVGVTISTFDKYWEDKYWVTKRVI